MSLYTLALFLHVSGAIGTFIIVGTAGSTLATLLLGIVFLRTTKPQLVTSILVMASSFLLGFIVSLPLWSLTRKRTRPPSPGRQEVDPFVTQTIWTRRW